MNDNKLCLKHSIALGTYVCIGPKHNQDKRIEWMIEFLSVDKAWLEADEPEWSEVYDVYEPKTKEMNHRGACAEPAFMRRPEVSNTFRIEGAKAFYRGPRSFMRWCSVLCAGIAPALVPPEIQYVLSERIGEDSGECTRLAIRFGEVLNKVADIRFISSIIEYITRATYETDGFSNPPKTNSECALYLGEVPVACRIGAILLWVIFHELNPQDICSISVAHAKEIIDEASIIFS